MQINFCSTGYYEEIKIPARFTHSEEYFFVVGCHFGQSATSRRLRCVRRGDPTLIRPGMVFTVEPGLYDRAPGGFRHSDTVLITEDGIEVLTYYPRDLESLTIPV